MLTFEFRVYLTGSDKKSGRISTDLFPHHRTRLPLQQLQPPTPPPPCRPVDPRFQAIVQQGVNYHLTKGIVLFQSMRLAVQLRS
jgi:hypothetical protein